MLKRLSVILLVLFISLSAGLIYAYWDNLTVTKDETITIGEGLTVEVEAVATAPAGKVLIPSTATYVGPNDVKKITLTYNVAASKTVSGTMSVVATASNVKINNSTTHAGLVTVTVTPSGSTTITTTPTLFTVEVTMAEPATQAAYDEVKGQPITFTLTFTGSVA
ncbi:MAG: hypothetical protein ACOX4W_05305 [Bacilli bacterium]|jgi:hypothetical protein